LGSLWEKVVESGRKGLQVLEYGAHTF
jgi:hypothetical protein